MLRHFRYQTNTMSTLAGAAVALVILVDLATGQGPPAYNAYLSAVRPPGPVLPPPPVQVVPGPINIGYPPAVEYRPELDKKADKDAYKVEKELVKKEGYGDKDKKDSPGAGVMSSISNTMSDAWSKWLHILVSVAHATKPTNALVRT